MLTDEVSFFVPGIPVPQGSKTLMRRGGKAWMRDANANSLKAWRHTVAVAADRGVEFDAPVVVEYRFVMPAPKRPRWSVPAVRPDLDKLQRSANDALVAGGLISDDARIVETHCRKEYGDVPGVHVSVRSW